ncbi:sulfatase [Pseudoruegeria sp. SHC-113]|uniref:sulfatase family protein n=1 Tax=Pseudoruegeria sp. SHC-113 TaxID=2855439 RepID=UPI0021BB24BB|nr:sulfatase-like hydrolase/transferase [Pseudoruegeria sp. SHC-113]MCT8158682.1 sulfatase-like hydrolase/transferase [Pseudoruegeria sp. SHC-113]
MDRPNILFLMPDQLRADFLGCYGADFARTPVLDALAARGQRFARCLSPTPICVPARASMLTGASSLQTGVMTNGEWLRPDGAALGLATWPARLADAGYTTYGVGKMHFTPWDDPGGFTTRVIAEDKRHIGIKDDYADHLASKGAAKQHGRDLEGYHENGGACLSPLPLEDSVDLWCADRAAELIKAHDPARPFAMMVGFPSPHCPYDPPPEIAALFDPDSMPSPAPPTPESEALRPWFVQNMRRDWADIDYSDFTAGQIAKVRQHYSALIHILDIAVGRVLTALEARGMAENTLILFASDHGDFVGDYGLVCKNFFMDGSLRVPMILAGPGISVGLRPDTVSLTDVFATVLDAAGLPQPERSESRSLLGPPPDTPRAICGLTHRGAVIERGRYKLARYVEGLTTLHDMAADPQEQVNLARDPAHTEARRALEAELDRWIVAQAILGHAEKTAAPLPKRNAHVRGAGRLYPHPLPEAQR